MPDLIRTSDPWFRPVDLKFGPDGALYIADFYNRIIGHYEVRLDHPGRDREMGRIWRLVYRGQEARRLAKPVDLTAAPLGQALAALSSPLLTRRMAATDYLADDIGAAAAKPLGQAHAHNDYYHKRPLLDALSHGFCSVEADVFLKNGKLLVGHFQFELREARSLEALYLAPLAKRVKANRGSVYPTKAPFHLMIDFKTDGPKTYAALQPLLEKYRLMLTEFGPTETKTKAVTIVISGSRPRAVMTKQTKRLAG